MDSFSGEDIRSIEAEGLTPDVVSCQLDRFRAGMRSVRLHGPCVVGDGIDVLSAADEERSIALHEAEAAKGRMTKFVPASGAASRMFRDWFRGLHAGGFETPEQGVRFRRDLPRYAFWEDLRKVLEAAGGSLPDLLAKGQDADILSWILLSRGLGYGARPKALLAFHRYEDGARTAFEEHLVEAALYARGADGVCRIHFSVSAEHREDMEAFFQRIRRGYEQRFGVSYRADFSVQGRETNTIAADLENRPFRDSEGRLVFRPGGHGALLGNLEGIRGDIVFLKNIDNVVPDRLKPLTVRWKKILSGHLLGLQNGIFRILEGLERDGGPGRRAEAEAFCRERLHADLPRGFSRMSAGDRVDVLRRRMHRPLRVCGMVRNEGEPGGGPFWTVGEDGRRSLQIIEEFQVDTANEKQRLLWTSATHFNPVDLVCAVRDRRGVHFRLADFVDPGAFCVARKSEKGKDIQALELPGLWNGSMAFWNTVFVEVPVETFHPVKNVEDLLRPAHQPEG